MSDVVIGKGKLFGKGVYATRNFQPGEVVKYYNLKKLNQDDLKGLPKSEYEFIHSFWGEMYLFPEPSRYTNHSPNPNTYPDYSRMCDIAIKTIKKGDMVTINAKIEVRFELETYIITHEKTEIKDFIWENGGYRNAVCSYKVNGVKKIIRLKRMGGNWKTFEEKI
ncbi:hypothetical protein KA021_02035 [Candidatus Saccharibacteria bacterium]|nr:hypothetical protein [Candidatus Saccharibacteria bacterium]